MDAYPQLFALPVDGRSVQELAWNPWRSGQLAVSCANERHVRLWELRGQPSVPAKGADGSDGGLADTRPALIAAHLCTAGGRAGGDGGHGKDSR